YATGDPRNVTTPSYPAVCQTLSAQFSTSSRSSPPASDDTSRIQSALSSCAGSGHSVVLAASGANNAFYSGKLTVNGEGLVVNGGVTLEGNDSYSSQSELVEVIGTSSFIGGTGTIDGRGDVISGTPRLIQTSNANNFTAYQITLAQAAHPHLYIEGGAGATVYGITTLSPATRKNADGIDIDSITDVTVINSSIEAGDDGIAIKTNSGAASNITIKNNRLYGTHGLSVGSQTFDGVTNVLFTGNYVYGVDHNGNAATDDNAIRIKTDIDCGGLVQQVTYQNTCITQGKHLIVVNANYGSCSGTRGTPQFKNIIVNGVKSQSSVSGAYTRIEGFDSSHLAQIYLANVSLDATAQSGDQDATVFLDNSNMTPSGTNVTTGTFATSGSVPSCSF
ncbi:MAG TPA: glycosyl hydrolase family 28 protein, partial [Steroidobacteraceae bacterium]